MPKLSRKRNLWQLENVGWIMTDLNMQIRRHRICNFRNTITLILNRVFPPHFDIAQKYHLPMYLHSRSTNGDFPRIVKENRHKFSTGVVHSFTGDLEELN